MSEESQKPPETVYLMVLADGETFSELTGCRIAAVPEGASLEDLDPAGLPTVYEFGAEIPDTLLQGP